jgi:primosomal protein N' (replication factor Y)
MFAEVCVNLAAVHGSFHYEIPDEPHFQPVQTGSLVTVPFSGRMVQGIVLAIEPSSPVESTKPLTDLLDPDPVLTSAQIALAHWMAKRYHAHLYECFNLMLPPGLSQRADSLYEIREPSYETKAPVEARLLALLNRRGPLQGRQLERSLSRMNWRAAADRLVRQGVLSRRSILKAPTVGARRITTARLALPPDRILQRLDEIGHTAATRGRRRRILRALIEEAEPLNVTWVYADSGGNLSDLKYLESKGLVALGEGEVWRDPLEEVEYVARQPPSLTPDQGRAWQVIQAQFEATPQTRPLLLHGVTGSGKTELYLRAVAHALHRGQRSLVLVPEIALTPQTVRRFLTRFPGRVGLVHSKLSQGERYDTWRRARAGSLDIVIGPRSALFTPLPQIGLIVLDESHDDAYKESESSPRYHARSTAIALARVEGALCLLGSATPDLTSRYRAERGEFVYVNLPQRILGHDQRLRRQSVRLGVTVHYQPEAHEARSIGLPPVRVVDMRHELQAGNTSLFSRPLQAALRTVLNAGQQAILFLNRRGRNTFVFCRDCGWIARCPRCDNPLAYHSARQDLLCHHCGYHRANPTTCPQCGSGRVRHFGAGTQRVESEFQEMFPGIQSLRWDSDTTRSKGAHEVILAHFQTGRAQVLIGTQMLAKGLDLPLVTLVGVVSADTALHLPDYRSAEKTFQILTQVAGRAGRGLLGGQVILQSYATDHYAIQAASEHNYADFYSRELSERQSLRYPPFVRLARLVYQHTSQAEAEKECSRVAEMLKRGFPEEQLRQELIGPVPCYFEKIRGEYRWQIVIRAQDPTPLLPENLPRGWSVDVDPVSLL